MKKNTNSDIQRLEKKINLLNDKIDKLMAAQGVSLQTPEEINEEEEKKRKIREKQQAKILEQERLKRLVQKVTEDIHLKRSIGRQLQQKFNLATMPSADRVRNYQKTNDPKAFDGLKRKQ